MAKKDQYMCMYIERVWRMLKYYNIYLCSANRFKLKVYRSIEFLNASRSLYFSATSDSKITLKNRIEIYNYIKIGLAINPSIGVEYILYIIRLFFDIFFTDRVTKVAFDIVNYIFKNFTYVGHTNTERLDYVLGTTNEDFRDMKRLKDYLEAKGYDVEYG